MVPRNASIAPPPERQLGYEMPEEQMYTTVAHFSFWCKKHPEQQAIFNKAQIEMINRYPIGKQLIRDTNLYNRKMRRKRHKTG